MDFSEFRLFSFDCYGTLIDWESGILGYLRSVFHTSASDGELLAVYAEAEPRIQSGGYQRYRAILAQVMQELAARFEQKIDAQQAAGLAESLPSWKPFPDTVPALRALKERYKLAIISNIDDDLFAGTAKLLEVPFDHVVTAEQAGTYKPSLRNFALAEERFRIPRSEWLHCAESRFHDIAPTNGLGIRNVWVNRQKKGRPAATIQASVLPTLEVPDMKTLATLATEA